MPKKRKGLQELSPSEWEVMKVVWEHGSMATGEIYEKLAEKDWAYSTVKTLMRRMVRKGWLEYREVGSSYLYSAAVPRSKAIRSAVRDFSSRVLDGLLSPFVAYYAEEENLSEEDLKRLEKIIRKYRKTGGS